MESTVRMQKRQHQLGRIELPRDARDNAVDSALAFYFDPVARSTRGIGAIHSLGHFAFEIGERQPVSGQLNVITLIHDLQARMEIIEQADQLLSSHTHWPTDQLDPRAFEDIEDHQHSWAFACGICRGIAGGGEPRLQATEVDPAGFFADHDLAVHERVRWQHPGGLRKLWKPRRKIPRIPTQQLNLAWRPPPEQAAESVKLRFVTPVLPSR
jgi:hypothetical protein